MTTREANGGTEPRPEAERRDLLIVAASDTDSDLYWATRFLVGDPVTYLELSGEKLLLVGDLELGRARREARVDRVVAISPYEEEIRDRGEKATPARVLAAFLGADGPREFRVPPSFPLGHAEALRELGFRLVCGPAPFFREREIKSAEEIEAIHGSQEAAEEAMDLVIGEIRQSEVRDGILYRHGEPLTSEGLRQAAHKRLLDLDHIAEHTIIAPGDQGCDPHERGHGPLPAGQTIIIDIFPRSLRTRCWGDITRTVVKGGAPPAVRKLWRDVLDAQEAALEQLRPGADGKEIHEGVIELFRARGNENGEVEGRKTGFFHGTGHGVGLDIHEYPRLGRVPSRLAAGQTVTVEPGLYYPGTGGVRIEDLVVITEEGHRNLTSFPKDLEV